MRLRIEAFRGLILAALLPLVALVGETALRAQDPNNPPIPTFDGDRICALATVDRNQQNCAQRKTGAGSQADNERLGNCNLACISCCNTFQAPTGWDRFLLDATCRCLTDQGATPNGFHACVDPFFVIDMIGFLAPDPATVSEADFAAVMRFYDLPEEVRDAMLQSEEALRGSDWMSQLPPEIQARIRIEALRQSLRWLQRGSSLYNSVYNMCGHLDGWSDGQITDWCRQDCTELFHPLDVDDDPPTDPTDPIDPEDPKEHDPKGPSGKPDPPTDEPCPQPVGQQCSREWDGQTFWGSVDGGCHCEVGGLPPENWGGCGPFDDAVRCRDPREWGFGGGGGDPFWLFVYQWY